MNEPRIHLRRWSETGFIACDSVPMRHLLCVGLTGDLRQKLTDGLLVILRSVLEPFSMPRARQDDERPVGACGVSVQLARNIRRHAAVSRDTDEQDGQLPDPLDGLD